VNLIIEHFSQSKKAFVLLITVIIILNSTMSSSLPSMAVPNITKEFGVTSTEQNVLSISVFLIGYGFGSIIWSPLSEHFGRQNPTIITFAGFSLFTMACALAPNWPALLVFRLVCGVFAGAPIAIVAGILADVYGEPRTRGRAFAVFIAVCPLRLAWPFHYIAISACKDLTYRSSGM
jgi:MFS family permease